MLKNNLERVGKLIFSFVRDVQLEHLVFKEIIKGSRVVESVIQVIIRFQRIGILTKQIMINSFQIISILMNH